MGSVLNLANKALYCFISKQIGIMLGKAASLIILSLLVLFTLVGRQAYEAEQSVPISAQLQGIGYGQDDAFDEGFPVDDWQSEFTLPPRISANEFQHQKQLTPDYELAIEFLADDLAAKHLVYIRTIPDVQPWFEVASFVPNKSRLSGWKESQPLYPK
jgi:hypothetical protein